MASSTETMADSLALAAASANLMVDSSCLAVIGIEFFMKNEKWLTDDHRIVNTKIQEVLEVIINGFIGSDRFSEEFPAH